MRPIKSILLTVALCLVSGCVLKEAFTFNQISPEINSISASFINAHGGDSVVFTGKNLQALKSLELNGTPCTTLTKISSTQVNCLTPSNGGIAGKVNLKIISNSKVTAQETGLTYVLSLGQNDDSFGYPDRTISNPMAIRIFGNKMFLVDYDNSRVLIWNSIPNSPYSKPDLVLGQLNFRNRRNPTPGILSASTLKNPLSLWTDGTKLAVADYASHRVLLWNSFPTRNGQPADIVLGQSDFTGGTANVGPNTTECGGAAGRNACSFNGPFDVLFEENKLIVVDAFNNRLLVWDGWPIQNQQPANYVIGQPTFLAGTSNNGPNTVACGNVSGRNACSLAGPRNVTYHLGKLIVSDSGNNRVLVFNSIPLSYGTPTDLVLGQPNVSSGANNNGPNNAPCGNSLGLNQCSLSTPGEVVTNGAQFYIADTGNHRILGWNSFPVTNQQPADFVMGHASFTVGSANDGALNPSASVFNSPRYLAINGNSLWVSDQSNHRILSFSPLPSGAESALLVWGHESFSEARANFFATKSDKFQIPSDISYDGVHLIIAERLNHRVIIETGLPTSMNSTSTRVVLGQPDHVSGLRNNGPNTPACGGVPGVNACSLNDPLGVLKVGNKLIVSEYFNRRVLIWNSIPTQNQQPADVVLGQPDFTSTAVDNGPNTPACGNTAGRNQCSLGGPIGLASDGTNLVVADQASNRILVWNSIPTTNQEPADLVIGQPNFTTGALNNGPNTVECDSSLGINRCSMNLPYYVKVVGGKLIASDYNNHRVLIWNTFPTVNQQPADVVLGQDTFLTSTLSAPSKRSMYRPIGLCVTGSGKLAISDSFNHRILVYNEIPTTNNAEASRILGQSNETGSLMDAGGDVNISSFNTPWGVNCFGDNIMISDHHNSRVLYFPL